MAKTKKKPIKNNPTYELFKKNVSQKERGDWSRKRETN